MLGYRGNGLVGFIVDGTEGVLVADGAEMTEALVALIGQPEELHRLRKSTTTFAPSVDVDAAMSAMYALYQRAPAMHGRLLPPPRPHRSRATGLVGGGLTRTHLPDIPPGCSACG